jgi:tricarballylate dehydrogenase
MSSSHALASIKPLYDVAVVGGGNAALCAAMEARRAGCKVIILEAAPTHLRGGNSRHTRNVRYFHSGPDNFLVGSYEEEEFYQDLLQVTGGETNEELARMMIRASADLGSWIKGNGVRWQGALKGTLQLNRTNAFFLGGGKALVNTYYGTAARLGVDAVYEAEVCDIVPGDGSPATLTVTSLRGPLSLRGDAEQFTVQAADAQAGLSTVTPEESFPPPRGPRGEEQLEAKSVIVASGGFEANLDWMGQYWGEDVQNFAIRGTAYNRGRPLQVLLDKGAKPVGNPKEFHAVAVDARGPQFDGGIVTRLDTVPFGIVVNREGRRFSDEGADFWPKRYASWGGLIAGQPGQVAFSLLDAKMKEAFMPSLYPPIEAGSIHELAIALGLDPEVMGETVAGFNAAVQDGTYDDTTLDDCRTVGLDLPKRHWARRLDTPPYLAYPLRPGITFTYRGLTVDDRARVIAENNEPIPGVFAAGESMAGNILGRGYLAGFGMTIGSVFGRIAGREAAAYALR